MPRQWDRRELAPDRATGADSARLSRYAARLLAAAATATAMSALVAHTTDDALLAPQRRAAAEDSRARHEPPVRSGDRPPAKTGQDEGAPQRSASSPRPPARRVVPAADRPASGPGADSSRPGADPAAADPPAGRPAAPGPAAPPQPQPPPSETIALTDDDRQQPLFDVRGLAPGDTHVRCLTVTYTGRASTARVRLRLSGEGDLARWLSVRVDLDRSPVADCSSHSPRRHLLAGTLHELDQQTAAGIETAYDAADGVPVQLRITTQLPSSASNQAAGSSATGNFVLTVS